MVRSAGNPLAAWLHDQLGIQTVSLTPVGGGSIHQAWCLESKGNGPLFAKTNQAAKLPLLEAEAEGLLALAKVAPLGLVIPTPLALGVAGDQAVLVLPWLALGQDRAEAGAWAACGANLARLHRRSRHASPGEGDASRGFGWCQDNVIGATPQRNDWRESWGSFFAECRLRPQLQGLVDKEIALGDAESFLARLPGWLDGHGAEPCLVHGDLWRGNAGLLAGGEGCLFDPAVYLGDREVDLAMAQLFGGFPAAFFAGYNQEWPLAEGWETRVDLYNFYHVLNHANLFGGTYIKQAQTALAKLSGLEKLTG